MARLESMTSTQYLYFSWSLQVASNYLHVVGWESRLSPIFTEFLNLIGEKSNYFRRGLRNRHSIMPGSVAIGMESTAASAAHPRSAPRDVTDPLSGLGPVS